MFCSMHAYFKCLYGRAGLFVSYLVGNSEYRPRMHFQIPINQGFLVTAFRGILSAFSEMSRVMREPDFRIYAKTKTQISCTVTAQLISDIFPNTYIVQSLYFLCSKFQASRHLLWLCTPVCVGPGRKPRIQVFS